LPANTKFGNRLSWVRSIFLLDPLIYLYTMVLGLLSLLSSIFDRSGSVQHGFARLWSWLILKTTLSPTRVAGLERLDRSRTYVFACNHVSALDIPLLYVYLPFQFRIIAKRELFRYPFLGWHLRRSGQLPIELENTRSSVRSLKRAVESLRSGMPLVVFPEGGRSRTGQIQPFLKGAFYIAIKAGVDVVPMALAGTYEVLPMNTFHIKPGPMELVIGDPIPTSGYSLHDIDALAARVQEAVEKLYYSRSRVPDPRAASAAG
jgi:1-acyl-sn-glycerol-3-phosphate acyltransferase